MKILVCVKDLEGSDLNALNAGIALSEDVTVLTVGPRESMIALKEALARGASRGILVSDKSMAGSDTLATAKILKKAIEKAGNDFNLILTGRESKDSATAQVGPMLAELLGVGQVTNVIKIGDGRAVKEEDGKVIEVSYECPAVISVSRDAGSRDAYNMGGIFNTKPIEIWDGKAIGTDETEVGEKGSPTKVIRTEKAAPKTSGEWIEGDSAAELAGNLIDILREERII